MPAPSAPQNIPDAKSSLNLQEQDWWRHRPHFPRRPSSGWFMIEQFGPRSLFRVSQSADDAAISQAHSPAWSSPARMEGRKEGIDKTVLGLSEYRI